MHQRITALDVLRPEWTEPRPLAGIRNFGWAIPGVLARGEQPALEVETFETLRAHGIRTVLSLRPDREPPPRLARRRWPAYHVEEEQRVVEAAGLHFRHVPLEDFAAPSPAEVAHALAVLDAAVAHIGPAVFVHCRAGAGRASVISGAWMVAGGRSGDEAASMYARVMRYISTSLKLSPEQTIEMQRRVRLPHVWWSVREIAAALGSPITRDFDLLPPDMPPEAAAGAWSEGYYREMRPWRDRLRRGHPGATAAAAD
jgi:protein tyrosine phosphatase (PTP) superfamily phosphohydrolase (DUF442 family)